MKSCNSLNLGCFKKEDLINSVKKFLGNIWVQTIILIIILYFCLSIAIDVSNKNIGNSENGVFASCKKEAIDALKAVQEMSKWLALIQTGVISALATLYKNSKPLAGSLEKFSVVSTIVFMGAGLFCTAWILSAIPSLMLRVGAGVDTEVVNDILSANLYYWFKNYCLLKPLKLEVFISLQHMYWGIGTMSFGLCIWLNKFSFTKPTKKIN